MIPNRGPVTARDPLGHLAGIICSVAGYSGQPDPLVTAVFCNG